MPTAPYYILIYFAILLKTETHCDKDKKNIISDQALTKTKTERLLNENQIEKSNSPWRAQPLVVDNGKGKRRMCIN